MYLIRTMLGKVILTFKVVVGVGWVVKIHFRKSTMEPELTVTATPGKVVISGASHTNVVLYWQCTCKTF
jgi:hypothetical protein